MNIVPAKVAGVKRIVMVVPTPDGVLNPLVMLAAEIAGADEVWRIGGAQAVAALAYGTQSIKPVDKITGPGNAYVAAAKRRVFGQVGIDLIAGPSEILVVADRHNDPAWIAADLLSQAEHDASSQSVLIADDAAFADDVAEAVDAQLKTHAARRDRGRELARQWLHHPGARPRGERADRRPHRRRACRAGDGGGAGRGAEPRRSRHAGAIFIGRHTPEAIGDYVAGTNHVLPTSRAARFSGGLGVADFLKRTSIVACTPESLAALGPAALALAEAEGLDAHGRSVSIRLNRRCLSRGSFAGAAHRRHRARRGVGGAALARGRARARGRAVRPPGGERLRPGRRRARPLQAAHRRLRAAPGVRRARRATTASCATSSCR